MKHRRLWSRLLVTALLMMIIIPAMTLQVYAGAYEREETFYIWSEDWSEVTANFVRINYDEGGIDFPKGVWINYTNLLATETVHTTTSFDENGNLRYDAHFTNPAFSDKYRIGPNPDDALFSYDVNSNSWVNDDTNSIVHSFSTAPNTTDVEFELPAITLPLNAKLTFWMKGWNICMGNSPSNMRPRYGIVDVSIGGQQIGSSVTEWYETGLDSGWSRTWRGDNCPCILDLSEYAGENVKLKFSFKASYGEVFGCDISKIKIHGDLITGWQQNSDGKWLYNDETGTPVTGWQEISNKWYYFDKSGIMQTGWQKIGKKWYFFNNSGIMQTGWKKSGGKWYYLDLTSGQMVTGWKQISDKWYYFKTSGIMAAKEYCKGYWLNTDGTWTYKAKASWKKNSKGWWYGDTTGWYAKNQTLTIDDKSYTFDKNGYCTNP